MTTILVVDVAEVGEAIGIHTEEAEAMTVTESCNISVVVLLPPLSHFTDRDLEVAFLVRFVCVECNEDPLPAQPGLPHDTSPLRTPPGPRSLLGGHRPLHYPMT